MPPGGGHSRHLGVGGPVTWAHRGHVTPHGSSCFGASTCFGLPGRRARGRACSPRPSCLAVLVLSHFRAREAENTAWSKRSHCARAGLKMRFGSSPAGSAWWGEGRNAAACSPFCHCARRTERCACFGSNRGGEPNRLSSFSFIARARAGPRTENAI